tara:strand:+ start:1702 stop:2127 length:426 start_codon:yes stop_codon:yes gene_type:complete
MLNAKASSLEMGTGGKPDITFQECADLLATVDYTVSVYARYWYANQLHLWPTLVGLLVTAIAPKDLEIVPVFYRQIAELALRVARSEIRLTKAQKAFATEQRHWKRKHEALLRETLSKLDEFDYELRVALKHWNEKNRVND